MASVARKSAYLLWSFHQRQSWSSPLFPFLRAMSHGITYCIMRQGQAMKTEAERHSLSEYCVCLCLCLSVFLFSLSLFSPSFIPVVLFHVTQASRERAHVEEKDKKRFSRGKKNKTEGGSLEREKHSHIAPCDKLQWAFFTPRSTVTQVQRDKTGKSFECNWKEKYSCTSLFLSIPHRKEKAKELRVQK